MKVVLETDRLLLRHFDVSDAAALMQMESEPDVLKYEGRKPLPNLQAYQLRIESLFFEFRNVHIAFGSWAIIEKSTQQFIGVCSLRPATTVRFALLLKYGPDDIEIGYGLCKPSWGNGYATEIVQSLIRRSFSLVGTRSVVACVMMKNLASIRVLEKSGFKRLGKPIQLPGEDAWSVKYHLNRKEFQQRGLVAG